MKRIIYFFAFALILGAYGRAYAQIDSITTTCNSAIIYFDSDFDTSQVDISVFRDTLIFEENFDNFLSTQVTNATPIGAAGSLVTIPRSLTQFPGCRAMNLTVADSGWCIIGGGTAAFATPKMNIPQGSIVKMKVSPNTKSVRYVLINGVTDTIKQHQDTISTILQSNCDEVIIERYNSSNITIDSLRIISPRQEIAETDRNRRGGVIWRYETCLRTRNIISSFQRNKTPFQSSETPFHRSKRAFWQPIVSQRFPRKKKYPHKSKVQTQ